ncbi:MAG TPA: IS66 family transposase [Arenicellales bacterium]|jgi:transposase|nr:IS66 family transposase [Arenicellales bacterium]|tara:strand:- start:71 stop:1657 length:1587 start_codon:yes stop_codon:yes gene_type:complete
MTLNDLTALPDDPKALKSLLIEQFHALSDKDTELQKKDNKISVLEEQINLLLHQRFGRSTEKYAPNQLGLFNEAEVAEIEEEDADADPDHSEVVTVAAHERVKRGRKPLPEHLPRIEVIHDLSDAEKVCPQDGHALHWIGTSTLEQLEIIPAKIQVIRHIRHKYACRHCETGVHTAPLPPMPIPKSMATPGLLAYVAISKYADALPLYRQEQMFKRIDVELKRATLASWMIRVGELIKPLLESLAGNMLVSPYIHMDETRVQVLNVEGQRKQGLSQMWVRVSGDADRPAVLFDYDPSRSGSVPVRLLSDYKGYLVTDGYKAYSAVLRQPELIGVGCWAHARRKFDEAIKSQGRKPSAKTGKAHQGLSYIQQLYRIERAIKDKPADERRRNRQQQSKPILDKIKQWVRRSVDEVPPATKLGKAIGYLQTEWERLVVYIEDGNLPIDNNRCENAIRPFVIGRKNWLFSNTDRGARASAGIYSLVETAKANRRDPYQYLRYVLTELPKADPANIDHLLPYELKPGTLPKPG